MFKRKHSEHLECDSVPLLHEHDVDNAAGSSYQKLHPKNPYHNNPPDFAKLSQLYPHILGEYVIINPSSGRGKIDWRNDNAVRALTEVLLQHDFNLKISIPYEQLCPPLPNRINYLCWVSDLIDWSS